MGILRTDKISGLETPTPVTGSVFFDGTDDDLQIADSNDFTFAKNDFTIEFWRYKQALAVDTYVSIYGSSTATRAFWFGQSSSGIEQFYWYFGSSNNSISSSPHPINTWSHLAAVRYNGTMTLYVDGVEAASTTSNVDVSLNDTTEDLRVGGDNTGVFDYQGYISNLRILNGTALYTSEFTPPTHELEVIGDTVLLCCNNPDSAGAEGTGKTITVNNDAVASTFSPGLTRDFTSGTEFKGVTTFDTQGYFVPPSGTTSQRGSGRGIVAGSGKNMHYIHIHTQGNSQDFGDLSYSPSGYTTNYASSTRGLIAGGYDPDTNHIDFITIATTGDGKEFGDIGLTKVYGMGPAGSNTRGLFGGGFQAGPVAATAALQQINYVTMQSLGNSQDFGDLIQGVRYPAGFSSPTRAIFAAGRTNDPAPAANKNVIQYVTIATLGDATDFGDLTHGGSSGAYSLKAVSSETRGVIAGGVVNSAYINSIDYVTITSLGNSQEFGDLLEVRSHLAAMSSKDRGVFAGGYNPSATNAMSFVTITSTGDAKDFGDLYSSMSAPSGMSDSHGGIS